MAKVLLLLMTAQVDLAELAAADARSLPADAQPFTRWLSLEHVPPLERPLAVKVLGGHLNSLSREVDLVRVREGLVGKGGELLRIDLRDYGWEADLWERLGDADPWYHLRVEREVVEDWPGGIWPKDGIFYKAGSFRWQRKVRQASAIAPWLGSADAVKHLVAAGQTKAPILRAEWFVAQSSVQEGSTVGYYDFLGVKDQKGFEALVRHDPKVFAKLEQRRLVVFSGITRQPRRVERAGAAMGGLWRTFDNEKAVGQNNPLRFLDDGEFKFLATEQLAPLVNGMMASYLGDANGKRQDKAPDNIVGGDKLGGGNDVRLHVYLSCIRCHIGAVKHEMGLKDIGHVGIARIKGPDYQKLRELQRQYLRDLEPLLKADREGYARAIREATGGLEPQEWAEGLQKLYSSYVDGKVDQDRAARELGVVKEQMLKMFRAVDDRVGLDPVLTILLNGGSIPQDQWEEAYAAAHLAVKGLVQP